MNTLVFINDGFLSKISKFFGGRHYLKLHKKKFAELNKNATFVALKVMQICQDINNSNDNKYLNVSIFNNLVEDASVALKVKHQSNKLGPHRHLGFPRRDDLYNEASNFSLGASTSFLQKEEMI